VISGTRGKSYKVIPEQAQSSSRPEDQTGSDHRSDRTGRVCWKGRRLCGSDGDQG
jgi:hypothetical protein